MPHAAFSQFNGFLVLDAVVFFIVMQMHVYFFFNTYLLLITPSQIKQIKMSSDDIRIAVHYEWKVYKKNFILINWEKQEKKIYIYIYSFLGLG